LPTYDEAANVEPLVTAVCAALAEPGAAPEGFKVLVVDDGSPDGTGEIAARLAEARAPVEVMRRQGKEGLGRAYLAGFSHALARGAGYVIEMDCDFSHDPAALPGLLACAREGADVALGSRYVEGGGVEGWSPARRAISRAGCVYARALLGVDVRDLTGGFKCFRAEALHAIDYRTLRSQGYAFQVEATWRALAVGLAVRELPIVFRERREGRSKMSTRIAAEAAWRVPALRFGHARAPLPEPLPSEGA
jgi:dolichol-phosphate mannosyltransferase